MTIETKTAVRKLGDGSIPAAAALTGEEVVLGLQDGESVEIAAQDIADLAAPGGSGYVYSGTTTAALSGSAGGTAVSGPSVLGVLRTGNGNVPSAGDTVHVWGALAFAPQEDGETFDLTLPYEAVFDPFPTFLCYPSITSDLSVSVIHVDEFSVRFTTTVTGDPDGLVPFSLTYQTANAVDP